MLACLNALRLVSRDEAWLVKPVQVDSANRRLTTNAAVSAGTVDVIDYSDIEKEYEVSYACLNLGGGHSTSSSSITSALTHSEVVSLLTSKNHYESALRIATIFDSKDAPATIVEHLAGNCVSLARECIDEEEAWIWLAENGAGGGGGSGSGGGKASEQAWRLLERLLPRAEREPKQTRCHRAAVNKILSMNCSVPYWLAASYKSRNPAELISLYHHAGLLEEATQVNAGTYFHHFFLILRFLKLL